MIRIPQLPGAAGIVQTVTLMRGYVNADVTHPLILAQAKQATDLCGRHDVACKALAIDEWTRRMVKYVPDPVGEEKLATPGILAAAIDRQMQGQRYQAYGDCDEMAMYAAALAKAVGLHPVFQVVGRGNSFSHVYVTVNGITIDPTVPMGTPTFRAARRMRTPV